ncbi:MAG: ion transporter [Alphaproteobacteria bacterium]|nr:ion transporter [Alphaproteobacteria bacterium]
MLKTISAVLDNGLFQKFIIGVILGNAILLGLMTQQDLSPGTLQVFELLDNACLVVFCVEIAMKLAVQRLRFFRDGWNVFDFAVVAIALAPASGPLAVLRAMRVFRLMRLVTAVPSMRQVITGMFSALPGVGSVAGVLFVMFYVAGIMGTSFFHEVEPRRFGDLGSTFFTLFQFLTLEGWPDVARPVIEKLPHAWPFFVIFIVLTTFTTLNLLFGIIVNAMEEAKEAGAREKLAEQGVEMTHESTEMRLAVIERELHLARATIAALTAQAEAAAGTKG